jgi:hypothetical protein
MSIHRSPAAICRGFLLRGFDACETSDLRHIVRPGQCEWADQKDSAKGGAPAEEMDPGSNGCGIEGDLIG